MNSFAIEFAGGIYLSTVDEVEDEIKFLPRLKRGVEGDEEGVELIVAQNVALRHDVLRLVASDDGPFLQDLDGVEMLVGITTGQEDFAETSPAEHAQEFEIIRFQP